MLRGLGGPGGVPVTAPLTPVPRPRASGWRSTRCASTARTKRWWPRPRSSSRTGSGCWVRGAKSSPKPPQTPHRAVPVSSGCAVTRPLPAETPAAPRREKDGDGEKEKKEKEKRLDFPSCPNEGANPPPAKHPKTPDKHKEKHKERYGASGGAPMGPGPAPTPPAPSLKAWFSQDGAPLPGFFPIPTCFLPKRGLSRG